MAPGILQAASCTPPTPLDDSSSGNENDASSDSLKLPEESFIKDTVEQIPDARDCVQCQVCVVGAGPAGLMLAANLTRFGIDVEVVDDRADQTPVGRADGLQPKTIETLRQMGLASPLLQRGVRVYDISFWRSTASEKLHRLGREVHYPPVIDVLDPYILLVHQGIVEGLFLDDMRRRGREVRRNLAFESLGPSEAVKGAPNELLRVNCRFNDSVGQKERKTQSVMAQYVVGCDGAHSKVRKTFLDPEPAPASQAAIWGVLDGELITDFPDLWSKTLVYSEQHGSVLLIPRERNMTRLYIELKSAVCPERRDIGQKFIMRQAKRIMAPYSVDWKYIEWFGRYQVGQRVASRFGDDRGRVFLAGDASHTHSPKSAQGMNTSMHDSWNLAWKLNLAARGLARPVLLRSYDDERRKIALDLVNFDYEHANKIAAGDADALADNFKANVRFISGVGAEYDDSPINRPEPPGMMTSSKPISNSNSSSNSNSNININGVKPGCLLPPAKATRFIDSNPVDVQLDIPMLGQFRVYLLTSDVQQSNPFLETFCSAVSSGQSFTSRLSAAANASYEKRPRPPAPEDVYTRPERYTAVSDLFTFALITTMPKSEIEISSLPPLLQDSRWTVYLDNIPEQDSRHQLCTDKWLGSLAPNQVAVINVRPDGYVGSVARWDSTVDDAGVRAAAWLDGYYQGFMMVPVTDT